MKTSALPQPLLMTALLATALTILPLNGSGENKPSSRTHTEPAESAPRGYDLQVDNDMIQKGGKQARVDATLKNVVDVLRERYTEANIVMAPSLANLKISDLKLRAGNLWEDLEAVRVASGGRFVWTGPNSPVFNGAPNVPSVSTFGGPSGPPIDPTTGLPAGAPPRFNSGLFILREPEPSPENERVVEAFNLGPYLQWVMSNVEERMREAGAKTPHPEYAKQAQESRQKAVQEGLDQLERIIVDTIAALKQGRTSPEDQPNFQFHRGANLFVVIGTREAVEMARKVVNALPGQFPGAGGPGGFGGSVPPSAEADPAFRQRYGLTPGAPGTGPDADAFRRRYGVDPGPAPGAGTPAANPNPPR